MMNQKPSLRDHFKESARKTRETDRRTPHAEAWFQ